MAGKSAVCSVCRVRRAVYYRRFSGHSLCKTCLTTVLSRGVKKSLRGINVFRPGVKVLVYVPALNPTGGAVLAELLPPIEEGYGGSVSVFIPPYIRGFSGVKGGGQAATTPESVLRASKRIPKTVWSLQLLRIERGLASVAAYELGMDVAVLPVTRTLISMLGVESMLSARLEYQIDLREAQMGGKAPVAYGFRSVESELVSAYAALSGVDASSRVKPVFRYRDVFNSIATEERPELEFSSASTIDMLASALPDPGCRCKYCRAPIKCRQPLVCNDCNVIWPS